MLIPAPAKTGRGRHIIGCGPKILARPVLSMADGGEAKSRHTDRFAAPLLQIRGGGGRNSSLYLPLRRAQKSP